MSQSMCRSRNLRQRVQVSFFFSPLHCRGGPMIISTETNLKLHLQEGVQHFPGRWVQLLIPIESYITCDFPGGSN